MKRKSVTRSLLNDKDLNSNYLREKLWAMINRDGKVDDVERAYYAAVNCTLKSSKKKD